MIIQPFLHSLLNLRTIPTTAGIPDLIGLFPKKDDIIIQGRYNTDIIKNQMKFK